MITYDQFKEYFRSQDFNENIKPNDAIEIFLTVLPGSSDLHFNLLRDLFAEYGRDFDEEAKQWIKEGEE